MALICLTGIPASGKTFRLNELRQCLQTEFPGRSVHVVSDDVFSPDPSVCYQDGRSEGQLRNQLKACIDRLLSENNIVICDSANYIRGFRYELFCLARGMLLAYCVVFMDTPLERAEKFNLSLPASRRYSQSLLSDLASRFERPNPAMKWELPLITVRPEDSFPGPEIVGALRNATAVRTPVRSIEPDHVSPGDLMAQIDQAALSVIRQVMARHNPSGDGRAAWEQEGGRQDAGRSHAAAAGGGVYSVAITEQREEEAKRAMDVEEETAALTLHLCRRVTPAELQVQRWAFSRLLRQKPPSLEQRRSLTKLFVQFLEAHIS